MDDAGADLDLESMLGPGDAGAGAGQAGPAGERPALSHLEQTYRALQQMGLIISEHEHHPVLADLNPACRCGLHGVLHVPAPDGGRVAVRGGGQVLD